MILVPRVGRVKVARLLAQCCYLGEMITYLRVLTRRKQFDIFLRIADVANQTFETVANRRLQDRCQRCQRASILD